MRAGDEWEVSRGRFSISGNGVGFTLRVRGPLARNSGTIGELRELRGAVAEALRYAVLYEADEKAEVPK